MPRIACVSQTARFWVQKAACADAMSRETAKNYLISCNRTAPKGSTGDVLGAIWPTYPGRANQAARMPKSLPQGVKI